MKHLLTAALSVIGLTACANMPNTGTKQVSSKPFTVTAALETPVVASIGDSADDPAIYIKNGQGFIAATDKQAGLYIYRLDGSLRKFLPIGTVNNVDLRDGFSANGKDYVLLVASNDELNTITIVLYDKQNDVFVQPKNNQLPTEISPYGICLSKTNNGTFHAGITSKKGIYQQYAIAEKNGNFTATKLREFSTHTKTEGCVFDDRTGTLYIAEEEGGLYRYPAAPSGKDAQITIAKAWDHGMKPDLEGVTVYEDGTDAGYLVVSSQGNNSFAVFSLPDHQFAGRFSIKSGNIDAVSTTDGIAAISTPTQHFPKGFLVVQDDMDNRIASDAAKKQNFKIIDWRDIMKHLTNK